MVVHMVHNTPYVWPQQPPPPPDLTKSERSSEADKPIKTQVKYKTDRPTRLDDVTFLWRNNME